MLLLALIACETLPATGRPFEPVKATSRPAAAAPAPALPPEAPDGDDAAAQTDGFDFDADAGEFEGDSLPDDPAAILAMQQGLEPPPTASGPAQTPQQPTAAEPEQQLAIPELSAPRAPTDWGLRLVSTMHNVEPPRAILGLPDGTEAVVTAGSILPGQNAVIMAIGRQQIEVAWVSGAGYQAKIETERLTALYPE